MKLDDYQELALKTSATYSNAAQELAVLCLGLTGESGEVADLVKKTIGHGHQLNVNKVRYELGDVLWYLAVLSNAVGSSLSEIAEMNVNKLKKRYPDGFSEERSINREE